MSQSNQQQELTIIETVEGINQLIEYIKDFEYIAFDTETTGLNKDSEIIGFSICAEETKAFYVILSKWSTVSQGLMSTGIKESAQILLTSLLTKSIIAHNAIFDCSMVENYFGIRLIYALHTDTMLLAHLLNENRRVGLKELGASIFGDGAGDEALLMRQSVLDNGGLITKNHYEMYKADSQLLALYGAKDALLTYKLFSTLVPELFEQGLDKFFYEEESMPLLKGPGYQLNTTGLKIDMNALITLKKTLEIECAEAKSFIYQEIHDHIKDKYPGTKPKNTFNIGSSQQLAWLLFGVLNLEFGSLTKGGKAICTDLGIKIPYAPAAKRLFIVECLRASGSVQQPEALVNGKKVRAKKFQEPWKYISTDKTILQKHAPRYKWIEKLLEYQRKQKMLSTYIEGLEERVQYGIIRPSFLMHGTTSGRFSSRSPNFQNIPRDDRRIKSCIISRPGKVFVGADYSQLEPRVFAYLSADPALLAAFNGDTDFYSVIGMKVYNKTDCTPHKDGSTEAFGIKYKKLRNDAKVIALASVYGATAFQLSKTTGKNADDSQRDIDTYFEEFPGVAKLMLDSHAQAKDQGYVTTLFGRKRRMPDAMKINKIFGKKEHKDYPYEVRSTLNLATNHRVQGTGASICNRAMIKFYNDIKTAGIAECYIVSQIHDEIIVECLDQDAENVKLLLQNAMETAVMLDGIVFEAVPNIAKSFGTLK